MHKSVLTEELLQYLDPKKGDTIVDATLGCAGHAKEVLDKITPGGHLIGIDQDQEAVEESKKNLGQFEASSYTLLKGNFRDIDKIVESLDVKEIDGIYFDLGFSSFQIAHSARGLSFTENGPLDMRMDRDKRLTAYHIVNKYPRFRLKEILSTYGEERFSGRIASRIVERRQKAAIKSTRELAELIVRAVGGRRSGRIHPATRAFQALRIEVNDELNALRDTLGKLHSFLKPSARICVISFHSLEDRIVKESFRTYRREWGYHILTKKPITPTPEEESG